MPVYVIAYTAQVLAMLLVCTVFGGLFYIRRANRLGALALDSATDAYKMRNTLLQGVISTLREDAVFSQRQINAIRTHTDSTISCARVTILEQATKLIEMEHTEAEQREAVKTLRWALDTQKANAKQALIKVTALRARTRMVSSALHDFTPEALEGAMVTVKAEAKRVNREMRHVETLCQSATGELRAS